MVSAGQLMTKEVEVCYVGDTLETAAMRMWERDIGCVPVVDRDGRGVGMLTDRDICMAAYVQGKPLAWLHVENAMSKTLFACASGDSLAAAEALMREHQVRRLPVIDEGKLVGILSMNDLARAAESKKGRRANEVSADEVEATLAAISRPRPRGVHA